MTKIYIILLVLQNDGVSFETYISVSSKLTDAIKYVKEEYFDYDIYITSNDNYPSLIDFDYIKILEEEIFIPNKVVPTDKKFQKALSNKSKEAVATVLNKDKVTVELTRNDFDKYYEYIKTNGKIVDDRYVLDNLVCYTSGGSIKTIQTKDCIVELTYFNDIKYYIGNYNLLISNISLVIHEYISNN